MAYKFCPECGAAARPGGRFCTACGQRLGGAGRGAAPGPLAGLVALVTLLAVGGGFWFYYRLAPEAERPLKPGEGRMAASGAPGGAASGGPAGAPHPPGELPQDIRQHIAGLAKDAESKPEDVGAWQTLARVYYRASRLDPSYGPKAEAAYAHLVEIDPNNVEGLRGLGNIAYDRQDRAKAIEFYEKVLAQGPDDPEVRTDMGTMLFESGQADRAIAEYQRAIEKSPSFFQAYFNLGIVYDARGDRAQARAQLEKARDLAPDESVKQRIGALLAASADGKSFAEAAESLSAQGAQGAGPGGEAVAVAPTGEAGPAPGAMAGGAGGMAGGGVAGAGSAAAPTAATFPASVEQIFRNHPIAGPKIVAVEWPAPDRGRIVMQDFPMEAMPQAMRDSYLERMRKGVGDAKARFAMGGKVTVELVDRASGKVMATVES
jgi:hypothetical protein